GRVVLAVAVSVEDVVLLRAEEAAAQGAAVAAVCRVLDDAQARHIALERMEDGGAVIRARVVDDDDLEVVRQLAQRRLDAADEGRDRVRVVVAGEEGGDARKALRGHLSSSSDTGA